MTFDTREIPDIAVSEVDTSRLLLIDGDSLGYLAGSMTSPSGCRNKVRSTIRDAMRSCGAGKCLVLLTERGSTKGGRFAVARRKPYQGQRKGHHTPHWGLARDTIIDSQRQLGYEVRTTLELEADDMFGIYGKQHGDIYGYHKVFLLYEDKDMRMLPGVHLDWKTYSPMCSIAEHTFDCVGVNGKQYGTKWFWEQMLQGDGADNIPGLPLYKHNGKLKTLGPATAKKLLASATDGYSASMVVLGLYQSTYDGPDDDWAVEMLEQATLLWMRRGKYRMPQDSLLDCRMPSSHFHNILSDPLFDDAAKVIERRLHAAQDQAS